MFHQEVSLMEYFKWCIHVVKIVGYCENPYCIIMKYYMVGSLKQYLSRNRALTKNKTAVAMAFSYDISRGILAIHEKGVCHLDLKPNNILLDVGRDDRIYCVLTDFGISQIVSDEILKVQMFEAVRIKGLSMAYAAPERIAAYRQGQNCSNREIVKSWDIYSFGIILFELMNFVKSLY